MRSIHCVRHQRSRHFQWCRYTPQWNGMGNNRERAMQRDESLRPTLRLFQAKVDFSVRPAYIRICSIFALNSRWARMWRRVIRCAAFDVYLGARRGCPKWQQLPWREHDWHYFRHYPLSPSCSKLCTVPKRRVSGRDFSGGCSVVWFAREETRNLGVTNHFGLLTIRYYCISYQQHKLPIAHVKKDSL
jgi:hypothetical protein